MKKALVFAAAALAVTPAMAGTATDTFNVTASVISSCSLTPVADIAFPDYDPLSLVPTVAQGTVTVKCSLGAVYRIGLNAGLNAAGDVTARKMLISGGGTNTLNYTLTQDLAGLVNWGTVLADRVTGTGTGLDIPTVIYGKIAAAQNATVGNYSDTIELTVYY